MVGSCREGTGAAYALKVCYTISVEYEWDPRKAAANLRKHGVSFDEASEALVDPRAIEDADPDHADRVRLIGCSRRQRILFVVYIEVRDDRYRIVTARRALPQERRRYEESSKG